jgi:hypothetical protein
MDAKVIYASCKKNFLTPQGSQTIRCTVPGAAQGDNVVVSSTPQNITTWGVISYPIHKFYNTMS